MTSTKTKAAKDGAEFEAYPTCSMAVLWNMDAHKLTHDVGENPIFEAPLDGDALARAANRNMLTSREWSDAHPGLAAGLRNNHAEIGRNNR